MQLSAGVRKSQTRFYCVASIVLRPHAHSHQLLQRTVWILCSGRPCTPPEQGQPLAHRSPPAPFFLPLALACRAGVGNPGGLLSRGFPKSISCASSPLADTYQSQKCWVKRHFCQCWPVSPVLLLLSLKDK